MFSHVRAQIGRGVWCVWCPRLWSFYHSRHLVGIEWIRAEKSPKLTLQSCRTVLSQFACMHGRVSVLACVCVCIKALRAHTGPFPCPCYITPSPPSLPSPALLPPVFIVRLHFANAAYLLPKVSVASRFCPPASLWIAKVQHPIFFCSNTSNQKHVSGAGRGMLFCQHRGVKKKKKKDCSAVYEKAILQKLCGYLARRLSSLWFSFFYSSFLHLCPFFLVHLTLGRCPSAAFSGAVVLISTCIYMTGTSSKGVFFFFYSLSLPPSPHLLPASSCQLYSAPPPPPVTSEGSGVPASLPPPPPHVSISFCLFRSLPVLFN